MLLALVLEWWSTFSVLRDAPPLFTAVGVAYLIAADRRRARKLAQLDATTTALVAGHTDGVEAHRNLAVTLKEPHAHHAPH